MTDVDEFNKGLRGDYSGHPDNIKGAATKRNNEALFAIKSSTSYAYTGKGPLAQFVDWFMKLTARDVAEMILALVTLALMIGVGFLIWGWTHSDIWAIAGGIATAVGVGYLIHGPLEFLVDWLAWVVRIVFWVSFAALILFLCHSYGFWPAGWQ